MIGKEILHYRILEKLGEGGMGVVYLAEDTRLERKVAIKFLPPHIAGNVGERQRFEIEAKAAASLNHPNIATIHAIEEADDDVFIVMEYIDGQELKDLVETYHDTSLPIDDTKKYAIQIAEGLQAAHEKGIVHRDIKSSNIMITEKGQAKIMDFGLAKVHGSPVLPSAGLILGTIAYMSPEQLRGEDVDQSSDIWAFGVVLYEILTGQLPFKGDYEQAVMYSILNEEPPAMTAFRDGIPAELVHLVQKTLEKKPDHRYRNMAALLRDLKQLPTKIIAFPKSEKSIVVLPFENISPDSENEYFSDGLTEEIIADLSQIEALSVISRTSAMRLKGTQKDIRTIGSELKVQHVLEGSVRKSGNDLRITAQLINAKTDRHLWAKKYSGTLNDVFEIQEKVARSIVNALKIKLAPEEHKKLAKHPIPDARAYDYYFRARQEILKATAESLKNAINLIQASIDIAGENILLFAARGYIHWMYFNAGIESDERHLSKAGSLAEKILALEPESVHGYRLLGLVEIHRGNIKGIQHLEKALQSDPNDPDTLGWLIVIYSMQGKVSEAHALAKKLITIDPLTPVNYLHTAWPFQVEGKFHEALKATKIAYKSESNNSAFQFNYFHSLVLAKKYDQAFVLLNKPENNAPTDFFLQLAYFLKFAITKKKEKALQFVTETFKNTAKNDPDYSSILAEGFALLNQKSEALYWLENAINRGFINYPYFLKYNPLLENLRLDAQFKQLMTNVKVKWEKVMGAA